MSILRISQHVGDFFRFRGKSGRSTTSTEAGKGEHHYYPLASPTADRRDDAAIAPRRHYLGVDAVRWYVNKQGNFFQNRMASGTVRLSVADESYQVGIGIYELQGQARTAPVFDRPVLPNRLFRGGRLSLRVFVGAIEQDTLLGGLVRDMASASLDVVAGAVGLATATGPEAILLAAGSSLINGLEKILREGKRPVTVFDPGGVDITLTADQIRGSQTYILVHRGMPLAKSELAVLSDQQGDLEVMYKSRPLDDGAWVLFRLRREDRFGSPRPWEDAARQSRSALDDLVERLILRGVTLEKAQEQLVPKNADPPTVADKAMAVVAQIQADHVLTESEVALRAGELTSMLELAQYALSQGTPQLYRAERTQLLESLATGRRPGPLVARLFDREAKRIAASRAGTLVEAAPELTGDPLWQTLGHIVRPEKLGEAAGLKGASERLELLPTPDPGVKLPAPQPGPRAPGAGQDPIKAPSFPSEGKSSEGGPPSGGFPGGGGFGGGGPGSGSSGGGGVGGGF